MEMEKISRYYANFHVSWWPRSGRSTRTTFDTRILDNRKNKISKMNTKSNKRPSEAPVANKKRLVSKTIIYDESKPNQWLDDPPLEIWDHVIIPMLGLKDLALARPVCTFLKRIGKTNLATMCCHYELEMMLPRSMVWWLWLKYYRAVGNIRN